MDDKEANATPAAGSEMRTGEIGAFCVIGTTVNNDFGRTWKRDLETAVAHGKKLIRNSTQANGMPKCRKLLVVQVVEVLEVEGPPIVRRKAIEEDFDAGE